MEWVGTSTFINLEVSEYVYTFVNLSWKYFKCLSKKMFSHNDDLHSQMVLSVKWHTSSCMGSEPPHLYIWMCLGVSEHF